MRIIPAHNMKCELYCLYKASEETSNLMMLRLFTYLMPYSMDDTRFVDFMEFLSSGDEINVFEFDCGSYGLDKDVKKPKSTICTLNEYYEKNKDRYLVEIKSITNQCTHSILRTNENGAFCEICNEFIVPWAFDTPDKTSKFWVMPERKNEDRGRSD